ncbi:right-handed parallel beta-helix repeat-containing protein [Streptomyces sp. 8L]|uniref:right-handed parallel beta-helix repeat-containing protein n=1 Tax=Streptomyces sp. 8L TaxID=2877242 RepID=UPI001CD3B28B|nr:right-handed parallel beta-helix repeat-containing protein [Streptomyces sp. 8L]MCA1220129.1 right-handed parallel beta-helix repeat-containing protein [Streptomyces sp. 8L]
MSVLFHVAPWGDDSAPGTPGRPLATPHGAQRAVRAALARTPRDDSDGADDIGSCGDVLVSYRAGTYVLPAPLELGPGDGGTGGRRVTHQPYGYGTGAAERVVFSGGAPVTGWTAAGGGSWVADAGPLEPRQLYVDGRRAPRARTPQGAPAIPGNVTKTETGYVTDSTVPGTWRSPGSVEFVFQGVYPWSEARLRLESVHCDGRTTTLTMAEPGFSRANALYAAGLDGARDPDGAANGTQDGTQEPDDVPWGRLGVPTSAENSPSFLAEPGTFALDTSVPGRHTLHYLPLPGEDPATAAFTVPVLERLVTADRARDITFRGLVFAHAAWQRPSGPGGFPHYHGNTFQDEGPLRRVDLFDGAAHLVIPAEPARVPAHVELRDCEGVVLRGNTFTRLGAGAVAVEGGGHGIALTGNVVEDVSGPGLSVDAASGVRIEDNLLRHIGREYHGSPAVWVSDAQDVVVAHNEIHDVPYSGIVVMGGERAARVRITENLVRRSLLVLADGGGVYLAGRQGDSYASGTVVRGNVLLDVVTPYNFGLYTDYGCSWTTVLGNVVRGAHTPAVLRPAIPLENVAFIGNFWDAHPDGDDSPPPGVVYAANTVVAQSGAGAERDGLPADIAAAAGRRTALAVTAGRRIP